MSKIEVFGLVRFRKKSIQIDMTRISFRLTDRNLKMGGKSGGKGGGGGVGCKGGGGGGKSSGGGSSKGGGGGGSGSGMMLAPGGGGASIPRAEFESNPQGYFAGLHAGEKNARK
ncbi:Hypothetical predicted protein [Olea europaea subsp. europaea]|uniref:Uncharacterized protein n=1 Tax=Olea europaea subsp. europaea TaxID=158383 RepID=A0A8S0RY35_OLEEU|nr:Hypothetical predicted protein [Olea europaea subsp. europaea]